MASICAPFVSLHEWHAPLQKPSPGPEFRKGWYIFKATGSFFFPSLYVLWEVRLKLQSQRWNFDVYCGGCFSADELHRKPEDISSPFAFVKGHTPDLCHRRDPRAHIIIYICNIRTGIVSIQFWYSIGILQYYFIELVERTYLYILYEYMYHIQYDLEVVRDVQLDI